jgi:hypothetical protein
MANTHSQHAFFAGDDWIINGALYDIDDEQLDLAGATIEWELLDSTSAVAIATPAVNITIVDASLGLIKIDVPKAITEPLVPGGYTDALRVTKAGKTGTLWVGPILVKAESIK